MPNPTPTPGAARTLRNGVTTPASDFLDVLDARSLQDHPEALASLHASLPGPASRLRTPRPGVRLAHEHPPADTLPEAAGSDAASGVGASVWAPEVPSRTATTAHPGFQLAHEHEQPPADTLALTPEAAPGVSPEALAAPARHPEVEVGAASELTRRAASMLGTDTATKPTRPDAAPSSTLPEANAATAAARMGTVPTGHAPDISAGSTRRTVAENAELRRALRSLLPEGVKHLSSEDITHLSPEGFTPLSPEGITYLSRGVVTSLSPRAPNAGTNKGKPANNPDSIPHSGGMPPSSPEGSEQVPAFTYGSSKNLQDLKGCAPLSPRSRAAQTHGSIAGEMLSEVCTGTLSDTRSKLPDTQAQNSKESVKSAHLPPEAGSCV
ncbi:hypothetical protein T484DRAFT_3266131 [Baffinella frigidus]|nr:hypothetical protein T484DRAFT_3266131 [Cryptophyta sp. CCMP2293]